MPNIKVLIHLCIANYLQRQNDFQYRIVKIFKRKVFLQIILIKKMNHYVLLVFLTINLKQKRKLDWNLELFHKTKPMIEACLKTIVE